MSSGGLAFVILFVAALILMAICTAVYNIIMSISDKKKKERDRQMGLYQESQQQNLSDRFK